MICFFCYNTLNVNLHIGMAYGEKKKISSSGNTSAKL